MIDIQDRLSYDIIDIRNHIGGISPTIDIQRYSADIWIFERYPIHPDPHLRTGAANLQKKYAADLEEFVDKIGQFRENENTLARPMLQLIREKKTSQCLQMLI